jgi:hypothetical protein
MKIKFTSLHEQSLKLQRKLYASVRSEMRKILGPDPKPLQKYLKTYKKEFNKNFKISDKATLLKKALLSDLILIGDYHTFRQSQRNALRLMRDLFDSNKKLILFLEALPFKKQKIINQFLEQKITAQEFLEKINYKKLWGFTWNKIPVFGINAPKKTLKKRDEIAGKIIAQNMKNYQDRIGIVLIGDLHLAKSHLPLAIQKACKKLKQKNLKTLIVFQNSEKVYWELAKKQIEHKVNVVDLGKNRFCIINSPPWLKLQSLIEWHESNETFLDEELRPESFEIKDTDESVFLEKIKTYYENINHYFNLHYTFKSNFHIYTNHQIEQLYTFLENHFVSSQFKKTLQYHITTNRIFYSKKYKLLYLPSTSTNNILDATSFIILSDITKKDLFIENINHLELYRLILIQCYVWFLSKIFNHKRKCDLKEDHELLAKQKNNNNLLKEEKRNIMISRAVLKHLKAQDHYIKTSHYFFKHIRPKSINKIFFYSELARALGRILGEKLYLWSLTQKQDFYFIQNLFKKSLNTKKSSKEFYLKLLMQLKDIKIKVESKRKIF